MLLIHGQVPLIVAFCTSFCGGSSHRVEVWVFLVSPQFKLGFVPEAGGAVEWLLVFVLDAVDVVQETDPPGHCECAEGSFRHSGALGGVGGRIPSLQLTFPPIQENLERRVRRVEINRCYRDLLLKLFPPRSSLPFSLVTQLKHRCLPTSHANSGSPTPWFSRAHFPALA